MEQEGLQATSRITHGGPIGETSPSSAETIASPFDRATTSDAEPGAQAAIPTSPMV